MNEPYYDDGQCVIYHGDCREILPTLEFEVIVTDPPYGMNYSSGWAKKLVWSYVSDNASIEGDDDTRLRDYAIDGSVPALCFGRYGIDPPAGTRMVLVWDKGMSAGMGDLSTRWRPNWELIFVIGDGFVGGRDSGVIRSNNIPRVSMGRCHPHMKPTGLLRYLLEKCPPGTVVDPFMGSGTTLRAAKDLGRKAIGIEIEERYCEIAAKRLAQGVLDFGWTP